MKLLCIYDVKCYCMKFARVEISLISIETGETVFTVNVFDENVSDDK